MKVDLRARAEITEKGKHESRILKKRPPALSPSASGARAPCSVGALALRPRMRCIVDPGEVLKIKVGVNLRRSDVGVAEELLDAAQVLARLEQMRREGVPEHMRVYV